MEKTQTEAQAALGKAWASASRVLFGEETCPLEKCSSWLGSYVENYPSMRSAKSGESVSFCHGEYSTSARAIANNEADFSAKFEPLTINQMKDIDSIAEALGERAIYSGNILLGNSRFVESSTNVLDSHFVISSSSITSSKYVAYSQYVKESEFAFGILGMERSSHAAKCMGSDLKRCFECHMVEMLSDCYYCAKSQNCQECMFCFGAENSSYMIGNTKLPKDRYLSLKKKLLSELAGELKRKGEVFSLLDIVAGSAACARDPRIRVAGEAAPPFDITPVDKSFRQACFVLFGREIGPLSKYGDFLRSHVPQNLPLKSSISGSEVLVSSYRTHLLRRHNIRGRMATENELREIGKIGVGEAEVEKLHASVGSSVEILHPIAYMNLDKVVGKARNMSGCTVIIDASDCLDCSAPIRCRKCAYSLWPSSSEAVFGSSVAWDSSYCLKCHYSKRLTRALEADSCEGCSDIYFSHNCENVRDSMFCFSKKNISHAIGNAELPMGQYRSIKSSLASQMASELEGRGRLKWDIFSIGSRAGRA